MESLRELVLDQQYELEGHGIVTYAGLSIEKGTRRRYYSFKLSSGKLTYLLPDDVRELVTEIERNVA